MTQITIEREKLGQVLAALKRMKGYGDTFAYRSSEQNPYQQVCEALEVCEQAITAPVQEPVGTYGEVFESMLALLRTGLQSDQQIYMAMKDKPLYTTPPATQPATNQGYVKGIQDAIHLLNDCRENSIDWLVDRLGDYKYAALKQIEAGAASAEKGSTT